VATAGVAVLIRLLASILGTRRLTPPATTQLASRVRLIEALRNPLPSERYGGGVEPESGSSTMTWSAQMNQASLGQRVPRLRPPPLRPQRAFSDDYPPSYFNPLSWRYLRRAPTDTQGRLLYDTERRKLEAKYVVGRRNIEGPDVALGPTEVLDVLSELGHAPEFLPESQMPRVGNNQPDFGTTRATSYPWPRSLFSGVQPGQVSIDESLDPRSRHLVASHELGHVLKLLARPFLNDDAQKEMRALYNTMNNPNRTPDDRDALPGWDVTPELYGYSPKTGRNGINKVEEEYYAEAFRAYMMNPNFVKTVAPNMASAFRRAVNSHPRLRRVIQFNSLRFPTYAGVDQSFDQQQSG